MCGPRATQHVDDTRARGACHALRVVSSAPHPHTYVCSARPGLPLARICGHLQPFFSYTCMAWCAEHERRTSSGGRRRAHCRPAHTTRVPVSRYRLYNDGTAALTLTDRPSQLWVHRHLPWSTYMVKFWT